MILTVGHLLLPYGVYLLAVAAIAVLSITQLVRFGTFRITNIVAVLAFLGGVAVILYLTALLLTSVDFSQPLRGSTSLPFTAAEV